MKSILDEFPAPDLPAELILKIFGFTFPSIYLLALGDVSDDLSETVRDMRSCALVCQAWRDAAVPILYEHVILHRSEQLPIFLRTLESGSTTFDFKMMVKAFTSSCHCIATQTAIAEQILAICHNLKKLSYTPVTSKSELVGWRSYTITEMVDNHGFLSSITDLSLGPAISSDRSLLQFLAQMTQLESLSAYIQVSYETPVGSLTSCSAHLPDLTDLSLTMCTHHPDSVDFVHRLSTPSLTRFSISFARSWNPIPGLGLSVSGVVTDIIAPKGASLSCLEIVEWQSTTFDSDVISSCSVLDHLVLSGCSNVYGTHPNLRFIDIWREIHPSIIHRKSGENRTITSESRVDQFDIEVLRTSFPSMIRLRILDIALRDKFPKMPTVLPPTRRTECSLRLDLLGTVIWDTPRLIIGEALLTQSGYSTSGNLESSIPDIFNKINNGTIDEYSSDDDDDYYRYDDHNSDSDDGFRILRGYDSDTDTAIYY